MGVYDEEVAGARADIEAAGEQATLRRYAGTTPDAAKPWAPGDAVPETQTVGMLFLNFNMQASGESYFNGTLVKTGDKKVLVAGGLPWSPEPGQEVVRADGSVWRVENVKTLDPNGETVLHTMLVRR